MSILQKLYDSEINFSISTLWDAGFAVKLGDSINGFKAETTSRSYDAAVEWLAASAIEHYPDSDFALRLAAGT